MKREPAKSFRDLIVWTGGINAWETTGDTPSKKHIKLKIAHKAEDLEYGDRRKLMLHLEEVSKLLDSYAARIEQRRYSPDS